MKLKACFALLIGVILLHFNFCNAQSSDKTSEKFVIILDIQKHFTQNSLADTTSERLIRNINHFISDVENKNVIYVQSILRTLNISFKGFDVDTVPNLEFDNRLNTMNDNIFEKSTANAFAVSKLNQYLEQNNAKAIIVIGLMAEQCVYETLLGGKEKGYEMYVVPEAIAAKSNKSKEKIIKKLTKKGIRIMHMD